MENKLPLLSTASSDPSSGAKLFFRSNVDIIVELLGHYIGRRGAKSRF